MNLTLVERLMLYALGQYYLSLNQPLMEKHLRLRTSKITFIEMLMNSNMVGKKERAIYKNLESLEKKKLIAYENKMIRLTEKGLEELRMINLEIDYYLEFKKYFSIVEKPKRKLQTFIEEN